MDTLWATFLIWAIWHILGCLAIETATTLPPKLESLMRRTNTTHIKDLLKNTRRIINGAESEGRPYMVYLKLPTSSAKFNEYKRWLCGGVIVHEEYIITSAACIEDVGHFYVVSGTSKFSFDDDRNNNLCIKNGAKKAVWKCIPRNYVFDGHENDNIRWMNNDIAVVKMEDEFDFTRRVRGCDYTPRPICYNNQSVKHEEAGQEAMVAGWGSTNKYNDWINSRRNYDKSPLLEAKVMVMAKPPCKKRWGSRYHNIIDNYMICTNDMTSDLSEICLEKYVDCQDIAGESGEDARRLLEPPPDRSELVVHSAYHNETRRQGNRLTGGGFCENDHGGPLVVGEGASSIVIGIISACLVKERTNQCYGPFLYTSVYKNRVLINCAIYKDVGNDCNKLFRASVTHTEVEMSWVDHPDGPAKSEVKKMRRAEEEKRLKLGLNTTEAATDKPTTDVFESEDIPLQKVGVILRSRPDGKGKNNETKTKHSNKTAVPQVPLGTTVAATQAEKVPEGQTTKTANVATKIDPVPKAVSNGTQQKTS